MKRVVYLILALVVGIVFFLTYSYFQNRSDDARRQYNTEKRANCDEIVRQEKNDQEREKLRKSCEGLQQEPPHIFLE